MFLSYYSTDLLVGILCKDSWGGCAKEKSFPAGMYSTSKYFLIPDKFSYKVLPCASFLMHHSIHACFCTVAGATVSEICARSQWRRIW
jgi:hypothetical protein